MGGREQGEGGSGGREGGMEGDREDVSGSGGREGGLRKGTSEDGTELGMDEARERGEGVSERRREGATERSREKIKGGAWGNGDREGGKLQGRCPEEDTGQYAVCRAQNYTQRGPSP